MLETSVIDGTNVVSLTVGGGISADQEIAARETIQAVVDEHGSARLLLDFGGIDVGRVEPKAAWEDLKTSQVLSDADRVAVIAGSGLVDRLVDVLSGPSPFETKTFDDRDEAVAWLTS